MTEEHYEGGCQCGAVRYEVDVDLDEVITCNCSRCKPMGFVLAFTVRDKLKVLSGQDNLTDYLFGNKEIRHRFCATCGVESYAYVAMPDGTDGAAINVNCLKGVDARALDPVRIDGAST